MSEADAQPSTPTADLEIRPVRTTAEFHDCEQIQRLAWSFEDDLDVVPLTQMVAVSRSGGVVLGAFEADGSMAGFTYCFRGHDRHGDFQHSHMTAVHPRLKAGGLGARLKWAQREAVLAGGLERIAWTYDPLESLNGYFNFSKLGVLVDVYWEDLYGATGSKLHAGITTDRFLAEWHLTSERVVARRRGERGADAQRVAEAPGRLPCVLAAAGPDRLAAPGEPELQRDEPELLAQIPESIQAVKAHDPQLAIAWRQATRAVFTHYLDRGWQVRECVRTRDETPRTLYLLSSPNRP